MLHVHSQVLINALLLGHKVLRGPVKFDFPALIN